MSILAFKKHLDQIQQYKTVFVGEFVGSVASAIIFQNFSYFLNLSNIFEVSIYHNCEMTVVAVAVDFFGNSLTRCPYC